MKKKIILKIIFLAFATLTGYAQETEFYTGCLPETNTDRLPKQATLMTRDFYSLPSSYSLRQYCPTPQSQGQYGTCTSWATTYAFRTILDAVRNNWNHEEMITGNAYAPLFIYSQIKDKDDMQCRKGSQISEALLRLQNVGAVKKEQFDVMCADYIPDNIMSLASANKIGGFTTLVVYGQTLMDPVKVSVIKKAISQKQPVVIAMHISPSFNTAKNVWDGNTWGRDGYHAMCVVGFDDNKYGGAFLIMNSWGSKWGNNGFIWVRYADFCRTVDQAYTGFLPNSPSPNNNRNTLSGELAIKLSTGSEMQGKLVKSGEYPHYEMSESYISGTRYRLIITNNEPAFVYVIGDDLTSNTSIVFPPREDISPALTYKHSHVAIPNEQWYIEMDDTKGKDYICVLYSKKELDIKSIAQQVKKGDGTFYQRIMSALGQNIVSKSDLELKDDQIKFTASTKNSIVPIIAEINHQ